MEILNTAIVELIEVFALDPPSLFGNIARMRRLIDSHTHLENFARLGELDKILQRAGDAGVTRMITVGTRADDWKLYQSLASTLPNVIAYTIGIHPCHVTGNWRDDFAHVADFFRGKSLPYPVAIGETGLDRFHLDKNPEKADRQFELQKDAFRAQIALAAEIDARVVVHSRGAFEECVDLIDASGFDWKKVVFHCFTEGESAIRAINDRGGRGSFTGIITYPMADIVRAAALAQGLDRLMIETDSPYLSPVPHRGKPNEPAHLLHIAKFAAELFEISIDEFTTRAAENTIEFFRLDRFY